MVSVILTTKNRSSLLIRALVSVYNQKFKDFEVIVVDDGSIDDTREVVAKFGEAQYFYLPGQGVSSARNFGVGKSKYDLITFLDDDDAWHPDKLKLEVDFLKDNPDIFLVHTDEIWFREGVRVNSRNVHKKSGGDIFKKSLKLCLISPSSVMLTKKLFLQMGGFDESFPVCEDYDLWLKITSKYKIGFISKSLTYKYGGHEQLSKTVGMDYFRIKSMNNILNTNNLSNDKQEAVRLEILKKSNIFLNGQIKHNNMKNFAEIFDIRQKLR